MPFLARMYIGSSVMSASFSRTRPESGAVSPTTIENVVVFPAPFGPSRPTTSPEAISSWTPFTTVRPLYDLVRSRVRSVAIQSRVPGHAIVVVVTGLPSVWMLSTARWKRSTPASVFLQDVVSFCTTSTGDPTIT